MARLSKLLLCAALVVLMLVVLCPAEPALALSADDPVCFDHDDVNGDGIVNVEDAIYILYHFIFGEEQYPLAHEHDFKLDGVLDREDALYLLHAIREGTDEYPLQGIVHEYYPPVWSWDEYSGTVRVTFKCGCGREDVVELREGEGVTREVLTPAGCATAGNARLTASVEFNGQVYTDVRTVTIAATGHDLVGHQSCVSGVTCRNCDYSLPALGHAWYLAEEVLSDSCQVEGKQVHACSVCGATKEISTGFKSHAYVYCGDAEDLSTGAPCDFVKQYICTDCGQIIAGTAASDRYTKHEYTAAVTLEATCQADGVKTYTCSIDGCGHSYTEAIAHSATTNHLWDDGVQEGDVKTYTCQHEGCGATKSTVSAANGGEVSKDHLADKEVELDNDATLSMDQDAVGSLEEGQSVKIEVNTLTAEELGLDPALQEQIVGGTVYDFSMVDTQTGEPVDFSKGSVTVSLPYTPEEGEDVDSINVWYIDDEGNVASYKGTYSNGFVTFVTNHFSYYTVTRLTPAQRCELYGHVFERSEKVADCTHAGNVIDRCVRCGHQVIISETPALGHNMVQSDSSRPAACGQAGELVMACDREGCNYATRVELTALAHNLVLDEAQCVPATCVSAGKNVYKCIQAGCTHIQEEILTQLGHDIRHLEHYEADCVTGGYDVYGCANCEYTYTANPVAPWGHAYQADWTWAEDYSGASVMLVCTHDQTHTKELVAVVTVVTEASRDVTCTRDGMTAYRAYVSYNNITYTDDQMVLVPAQGHQPGQQWQTTQQGHCRSCEVCGQVLDEGSHAWAMGLVLREPTCDQPGAQERICEICDYSETLTIPATGNHHFENGVCQECGMISQDCDHDQIHEFYMQGEEYGLCRGTRLFVRRCDCGYVCEYYLDALGCVMSYSMQERVSENGIHYLVEVADCDTCGLVTVCGSYIEELGDCVAQCWYYEKLELDGEVLKEITLDQGIEEHMVHEVERIELTPEEHGVCGITIRWLSCDCGANAFYEPSWNCHFVVDHENSTEEMELARCENCGVVRQVIRNYEEGESCQVVYRRNCAFLMNGQELAAYTHEEIYYEHDFCVSQVQMLGADCSEGVLVKQICRKCGTEEEFQLYSHEMIIENVIDLAELGLCGGQLFVCSCPCGLNIYQDVIEDHCQWERYSYDLETEMELHVCGSCGATKRVEYSFEPKNENCERWGVRTVTVFGVDGAQLYSFWYGVMRQEHNMVYEHKMLGDSCEDGVIVHRYCLDCQWDVTEEVYYHHAMPVETYDLSQYGCCTSQIILYRCPCGQENWIEEVGEHCQWEWKYDKYSDYSQCTICGLTRILENQFIQTDDPCWQIRRESQIYAINGFEIVRIDRDFRESQHSWIWELTLVEGAQSCEDGYMRAGICCRCGQSQEQEGPYYGHERWVVQRELVTVGLCSDLYECVERCACGQEECRFQVWEGESCSFDSQGWSEEKGCELFLCSRCGAQMEHYYYEERIEGTTCQYRCVSRRVYLRDGFVLYTYEDISISEYHQMVISFQLLGQTCEDGYYRSGCCVHCGHTESYDWVEYGCRQELVGYEVLDDGTNLCGKLVLRSYSCACGIRQHQYTEWENGTQCEFEHQGWSEELNAEVYICRNCGVIRSHSTYSEPVEGDPCGVIRHEEYVFYRDDAELLRYQITHRDTNHRMVAKLTLLGETCDDGYYFGQYCVRCGYEDVFENVQYGCGTWTVLWEICNEGTGMCGDLVHNIDSCACGRIYNEYYYWDDGGCQFLDEQYDRELGGNVSTCINCGVVRVDRSRRLRNPELLCQRNTHYDYAYLRNGEVILQYSYESTHVAHSYLTEFTMLGETCDDGYYVSGRCAYCGSTYHQEEPEYGCISRLVEAEILYNGEALCGGSLELRTYSCPCGQNSHSYTAWDQNSCSYEDSEYVEELDAWISVCVRCGNAKVETYEDRPIEGETCKYLSVTVYTYYDANWNVVASYERSHVNENHSYISSFEMLGQTCQDGYYVTNVCVDCGYAERDDHLYTECQSWELERSVLYDGTGICGPVSVIRYGCPCGREQGYGIASSCNLEYQGYDEQVEMSHYICADCGMEYYELHRGQRRQDSCIVDMHLKTSIWLDGVILAEYEASYESRSHEFIYSYECFGDSCEDGYYYNATCYYCGNSRTGEGYGHNTQLSERYDLSQLGGCGGYLNIHSCACGQNSYENVNDNCSFHSEWTTGVDADGEYELETSTCETCGMKRIRKTYIVELEGVCLADETSLVTYRRGNLEKNFTFHSEINWHNWGEEIFRLAEGATSCLEGLESVCYCLDCGEESWAGYGDHRGPVVNSFDLTQYGSICGGTLDHIVCACGQKEWYEFSSDLRCDLGMNGIDLWIENVLENQYIDGIGGGWVESYAWEYVCAVTNPEACGLRIRMAEYWVQEGCLAVQYHTWLLGYDETTGTAAEEITYATGQVRAKHSYAHESNIEELEDGTRIERYRNVCDCGSYNENAYHYNADGLHMKTVYTYVNTIEGFEQQWYTVDEYRHVNGYAQYAYYYHEIVYADGSVFWEKREYIYASETSCEATEIFTNSNGVYECYESANHNTGYQEEIVQAPTCSQFGSYHWWHICHICGVWTDENQELLYPNDHNWSWNDRWQTWVCLDCGLESVNGASGSIIMEDLTESFGNGSHYVVGYYNQGHVEFNPYVSLILSDVTEGMNDELVLTGIDFTYLYRVPDGINALTFAMEQVRAAAEIALAEAGYTGEYAVRISFVPMNGDDTLDYAITFGQRREDVQTPVEIGMGYTYLTDYEVLNTQRDLLFIAPEAGEYCISCNGNVVLGDEGYYSYLSVYLEAGEVFTFRVYCWEEEICITIDMNVVEQPSLELGLGTHTIYDEQVLYSNTLLLFTAPEAGSYIFASDADLVCDGVQVENPYVVHLEAGETFVFAIFTAESEATVSIVLDASVADTEPAYDVNAFQKICFAPEQAA